ncbi:PP2C family protein-serine/threonine phosphatase [Smaragdicoccus niigatensis]|uniref:PP2C family protein-serine/threonine phosphatase n=1 Tax=Smaragdicoccus niigatensis TaxID=359359 RepID=UPI000376F5E5|nr:protein phosphatase 2C domain-containing protein [Smaragdicoccus niigatensis]
MGEHADLAGARITWGAATDVGKVRSSNQDAWLASPPVFVVADGMGGHENGEKASHEAVAAMTELAGREDVDPRMIVDALHDAHSRISSIESATDRPPGTTMTGAIVTRHEGKPAWLVLNIGDSRTYLFNPDEGLAQISKDHSAVQEWIDAGKIDAAVARTMPGRNIITRALMAHMDPNPQMWIVPLQAGDRILICSDGLTNEVEDETMAEVLRTVADPQTAVDTLVELALESGGRDNVTVLIVDGPKELVSDADSAE